MTTDYEYKTESAEVMLQITFCQIMLKKLMNKFKTNSNNAYLCSKYNYLDNLSIDQADMRYYIRIAFIGLLLLTGFNTQAQTAVSKKAQKVAFIKNQAKRNTDTKPSVIKLPNDTILVRKAKNGDANAQAFVGKCYYVGEYGVRENDKEALSWFLKSAQKGSAYGTYYLGLYYQYHENPNSGNYLRKAFGKFKQLAESGDVNARYYLGLCYKQGNGIDEDESEAEKHFKIAAENNNTDAMCKLAEMASNPADEYRWYKKAAALNSIDGIMGVGSCYRNASGVERSYTEAFNYYRIAAERGNTDSQYMLASFYENGTGVERDLQKAIHWYEKSAESSSSAAYKMGCFYRDGVGIDRNYNLAVSYFRIAAEDEDDEDAKYDLKDILSKGATYYSKLPKRSSDDLYELMPEDPFSRLILSDNWDELTDELKTIYLKHFKKQKIREWGAERAYQVASHLVEIGFTKEQLEYSQGRDYEKQFVVTPNGKILIMVYSHCIYYLLNNSLIAMVWNNGAQVGDVRVIQSCKGHIVITSGNK